MLTRLRSRRGDEGTTVTEVMVVTLILGIVMTALFAVMVSLTNNERHSQALAGNEEDVRFALISIGREIRSADDVTAWTAAGQTKGTYASNLQMTIGRTSPLYVRYVFNAADNTLRRYQMPNNDPATAVSGTGKLVARSLRNAEAPAVPLFRYYDAIEPTADMVTRSDIGTTGRIAQCALRVNVTIRADSNPGPVPFTKTADFHFRNRLPGELGC